MREKKTVIRWDVPPSLSYISIEVQRTLFSILCSQKQEAATGEPRTTRLDRRIVLYNAVADIGVDHRQKGPSSVFQNPRVLSILGFSGGEEMYGYEKCFLTERLNRWSMDPEMDLLSYEMLKYGNFIFFSKILLYFGRVFPGSLVNASWFRKISDCFSLDWNGFRPVYTL